MSEEASSSGANESVITERDLLKLAQSKPDGISQDDINIAIPNVPIQKVAIIINKCLKNGSLEIFKKGKKIIYKYKDTSTKTVNQGTDIEERIVYKIIEEAGNKGIWSRNIRLKSNLSQVQMTKVLKSLEKKNLIKAVKSVAAGRKLVYMLYNLTPDISVTGGVWYQGKDFDSQFVDILTDKCLKYLRDKVEEAKSFGGGPTITRNRSFVTVKEVHEFISNSRISNEPLSVSNIESILYVIILDNNAEREVDSSGSYKYRAVNKFIRTPSLLETPCGLCPVISTCSGTDAINPRTCNYLTEWLE